MMKLNGEQSRDTLTAALNYSASLDALKRYREAKSVLRKMMPVARRVLRDNHRLALKMRWNYAKALYRDAAATFDDLREAVTTLEDAGRTARHVMGGAHPITVDIGITLQRARTALRAHETSSV